MIVVNPTGGGLSNGKLALANATAGDVLSGKTFFAGGREMQTGTLVPTGNSKTGTFSCDSGSIATVSVGFSPKAVVIYIGINGVKSLEFKSSTGANYRAVYYPSSDVGNISTESNISISGNGFNFSNPFYTDFSIITYYAYG